MTVIAIVMLAVWALGIVATVAGIAMVGREHPLLDMAIFADPVRTCLALAVVTVFWPAAAMAAGLHHLTGRRNR